MLAEERDLKMPEALSSLRSPAWLKPDDLRIFCLRTFQDCLRMTRAGRFLPSSPRLMTWGTAWNYTRAEMRDPSSADSKTYDQNIVGTALSWTPDNWTFSFGGGWYQNFLTTKKTDVHNYFAGDAWGIEYFAGYKFPINQYAVKSIQPYFMGDRLEYVNGRNYQRIDNGLGISFQLDYGFRVDYEHVFTSSTDNLGDMNLVRLRYDF